jgi:hypothetical protein
MRDFDETMQRLVARRGKPTCTETPITALDGANLTRETCIWKQPWGHITFESHNYEDVTKFSLAAMTREFSALTDVEYILSERKKSKAY